MPVAVPPTEALRVELRGEAPEEGVADKVTVTVSGAGVGVGVGMGVGVGGGGVGVEVEQRALEGGEAEQALQALQVPPLQVLVWVPSVVIPQTFGDEVQV